MGFEGCWGSWRGGEGVERFCGVEGEDGGAGGTGVRGRSETRAKKRDGREKVSFFGRRAKELEREEEEDDVDKRL